MTNRWNRIIFRFWAPVYDLFSPTVALPRPVAARSPGCTASRVSE